MGCFVVKDRDLVRRKPVPAAFPADGKARLQRRRSARADLTLDLSLQLLRKQMPIPGQIVFGVWRGVAIVQSACLQVFEKECFSIYVVQF